MSDSDDKVARCQDGSLCGLCQRCEGYCGHHQEGSPASTAYEPTDQDRRTVKALATADWNHSKIAEIIGVSKETMYKYFREELDHGEERAIAAVTSKWFEIAVSGQNPRQTLQWLERRDPEHWKPPKKRADVTSDGEQVDASPVIVLPDNGKKDDDD